MKSTPLNIISPRKRPPDLPVALLLRFRRLHLQPETLAASHRRRCHGNDRGSCAADVTPAFSKVQGAGSDRNCCSLHSGVVEDFLLGLLCRENELNDPNNM